MDMKAGFKSSLMFESIQWLRRQGHNVVSLRNIFLYDQAPGIYQAFPYHSLINISSDELHDFFYQTGAIALRYSAPLNSGLGKPSYHVVCTKKEYSLASLSKKPRRDVKLGLDYASYEPIPISRLATDGWRVRYETLVRQGRTKAESKEMWETLCMSADGLSEFEAWGAIYKGVLIASVLCHKTQNTLSILYQQSLTEHLKFGINNALTYVVTHEMMQLPNVQCIFYGLESLDAPSSVDAYKFRMGYTVRPVLQRVVFNSYLAPLMRKPNYLLLKLASQSFSIPILTKAEGLFRFYLQRNCALCEQSRIKACWIKKELSCPQEVLA